MSKSIETSTVYKRIFEDDFIYKAIYSLESYVFEKDLLEKDDYILMLKLRDPFNHEVISDTIKAVKRQLEIVLIKGGFFEAQVYFRPKKIKSNGILESRPLHSASLITLISSVVLLNVLLVEIGKNEKTIELTELARMLPSNFYGNIPSEKPEYLFKPWYYQYKEYTEAITKAYHDYMKTKEYKYEVTLDLKNFFPSINPSIIFDEIMERDSVKYEGINRECLKTILSKLLVFKITNIRSEEHVAMYYESSQMEVLDDEVWSRGIPQGLPHAYFFGNICMIKVAEIFEKVIAGVNGKAFYYVDDSVIYTNNLENIKALGAKIKKVNEELKKLSYQYKDKLDVYKNEAKGTSLEPFVNILDKFNYLIEVHPAESEKSTVIEIQNPKYGQANLNAYSKLASMTTYDLNKIFSDTEEINLSRKLEVIYKAVEKEIDRIRNIEPYEDTSNYMKVLLRFKKFFKYRQRRMEYNRNNDIKNDDVEELLEKFNINNDEFKDDMKNFFKSYDEDILLNEFRFFFANRSDFWELAESSITNFNSVTYKENYKWSDGNEEHTIAYFHKMCKSLSLRRTIQLENNGSRYNSILKIVKANVWNISKSSKKAKENEIQKAIYNFSTVFKKGNLDLLRSNESKTILDIIKATKLFAEESNRYKLITLQTDELYRIIMNAYFSELISVEPNDLKYLAKRNNKPIYYNEARVLLFLRNRRFCLNEFNLQFEDFDNGEALDYTLFEVVDFFEKFVQEPVYIDNLILVHKYTSDIWKNGSKYLHFYTLHNQDHAIELIRAIVQFMKSVNYFQIDKRDYYILFISCYLHDISMVLHPNLIKSFIKDDKSSNLIFSDFKRDILELIGGRELHFVEEQQVKKLLVDYFRKLDQYYEGYVRNNHPKQSARFIRKSNDFGFVDDIVKEIVAEVSQAHGYNVDEIYKIKSNAEESIVSEKYLKILLRIGDLLDMSSNRISNAILNNSQESMSEITRFHWLSHKAISNVEVLVNYALKEPDNEVEYRSWIGPGSIIENVEFVIYLDVKHLIGTSKSKECLLDINLINEGEEETASSFDISIGSSGICESCNFMCKWMKNKNEYLYWELEALQQYLKRSEANLFSTNIKVKYVFNDGARRLNNSEYASVLNYISSK